MVRQGSIETRIKSEQTRRLYGDGPIVLIGTVINAFIVTGILGHTANRLGLIIWLSAILVLSAARFVSLRQFLRQSTPDNALKKWRDRFFIHALISGLLWGSTAFFLISAPNAPYQPFIAFVIGGMIAATVAVYSSYFPVFVAFAVPSTLPIAIVFMMPMEKLGIAMGAMILLFMFLMLYTARRLHHVFINRLELQWENGSLIEELKGEIEERKAAQEALERSKANVEKKVEQRTAELNTLNERLQQAKKMEAIGCLAGGVAHDLNNILSGIVSYPEFLLLDLSPKSPLHEPLTDIHKAGRRAADVVQDLLTLSRRGITDKEVMKLNNLIETHLTSREHKLLMEAHRDVRIVTQLETDLLNIEGSGTHLTTMVMTLITNAVEALPVGGTITLKTQNRYIDHPNDNHISIDEGEYVVMTVADNGIGMSKDVIERIFEPFFSKKKLGRSGSGLGMALVWGTVVDHGGDVTVDSAEGEGATFDIRLPATRRKVQPNKAPRHIEEYLGRGERILIVDDVEEQRNIGVKILTKLNYNTVAVSSGEKALDYLDRHPVDLLILDMVMEPGMDGLDTYRNVLKKHRNQRAIVASGFSETDMVKEVRALGVGAYLSKPYTVEKLGVAVRSELDKPSP